MKVAGLIRLMGAVGVMAALTASSQAQSGRGRTRYMDDLANQDYQWAFAEDVFTFARLKHQSGGGFGYARRSSWMEDAPNADVMLAFRVHEITSINVRPGFNPIDISKDDLARFPFVYFAGVERLAIRDDEAAILRNYMLSGGFILVDNFWGDAAWANFASELRRIFPQLTPVELSLDHPIFHSVYDFKAKPQIPTAGVYENFGVFYDPNRDYDTMGHEPHYFALFDDKGRMMMLMCHNNHFGDGWEHEGDDPNYFHVIAEGMAYPMFINTLVYAMTH